MSLDSMPSVVFLFSFFLLFKEIYYFLTVHIKSKQEDMQKQSSSTWMSFYKFNTVCFCMENIYSLIAKKRYIHFHSCKIQTLLYKICYFSVI